MSRTIDTIEQKRLLLQDKLDADKTKAERNRLGQFATPTDLARDILQYAENLLPRREKIRFLDPAVGTGAFYSALRKIIPKSRLAEALGFEIDPHYAKPATVLWEGSGLQLKLGDFTQENAEDRFNLVICNPPYVRHHHLENNDKIRLQLKTLSTSGMKLSGLSGLYCHFIGLSHSWMTKGGIAGWLIPSEFMDVNYGRIVKQYLLDRVTLLHIHRFDPNDVQFADALVSSAVVWFRNSLPPRDHKVIFTLGGSLLKPKLLRKVSSQILANESKWTRFPVADIRKKTSSPKVSDFFRIKRGLATGNNKYFILSEEEILARGLPMEVFSPILPGPRFLLEDEVKADPYGNPLIKKRLFLLDTKLPEVEISRKFPTLYTYLEEGRALCLHERYLCRHRSLWYSQEDRPPPPVVCTYIGRGDAKNGRPFRFILNSSRATVANVYLAMYPTPILVQAMKRAPNLIRRVWEVLNRLTPERLLNEGRVYGGGLHKLEPKELANVSATEIAELIPFDDRPVKQADLLAEIAGARNA